MGVVKAPLSQSSSQLTPVVGPAVADGSIGLYMHRMLHACALGAGRGDWAVAEDERHVG